MKKVLVFVLCFMLCFVLLFLCACGNTNEKNYEIKMFHDLLEISPYGKQITKLNELEITFNSDCRDENMPASRAVEILGNAYTAPYWKSEWHYGVKTHYYYLSPTRENPDPELIMFMIDAKTDELTSYLIPYKVDAATEDEYLEIIRNEILPEYDLSAYQYTCTTVYNDGEIDDRIEQSFHVCDQNETLKYYDFDFRNMIGGYSTNDYLSVRFMKASETVSVHTGNRGYTENDFKKLLNEYDTIKNEIYSQYLNAENALESYKITKLGELRSHLLYLDHGVPHLSMKVGVWFEDVSNHKQYYTIMNILVEYTG